MFRLTQKLPVEKVLVAVSGGIDSMAALHWLSRSNHVKGVLHVHHGTEFGNRAYNFVHEYCMKNRIEVTTKFINTPVPKGESKEKFWRDQRYAFFHSFGCPVVIAHNMDDCLEEYVMSTMVRGFSGTIPYENGNCIRPFRLWKRKQIENYAKAHKIEWIEDESNLNTKFKRNYIRHEIIPSVLKINPGVYKIVEKIMAGTKNK